MRKLVLILTILVASIAEAQKPAAPKADEVARRALDVLGGGPAWDNAKYIAFTFKVERDGKVISSFRQAMDRNTGTYRVSGNAEDGVPFDIVVNIPTRKGKATYSGKPVSPDSVEWDTVYNIALRRFINDMNWLLMPLEVFDARAHRTLDGQRTDSCGRTWDVLKLTWDPSAGFGEGDVYWLWINHDTGVVEEWDTKSGAAAPEEAPIQLIFREYRRVGGLLLSARREVKGKNQVIRFDDLVVLPQAPKDAFD
ncbi:MAG TPA: hypothetical protein VII32_16795 [Thermoanaerobaculia bacterium]|jgi:hypothetical protein